MDADVTTTKDAYERILGDFRTGRTDILIGTQMIAKGLHFPNVTLVGVVYADLSLHLPDFRAGERTFQLLAQVAGRAGRGDVPGEVIVQTYTPFQPAIQAARRVDYDGFSEQELEFRRELSYPPFARLLCLHLKGPEDEEVARTAQALAEALRRGLPLRTQISEASPAPLARAKGLYRYQVTMRSPSPRQMATVLRQALRETRMPRRVTCAIDMDAMSLM
jgi:primosomal protein N' (replication factor Y)